MHSDAGHSPGCCHDHGLPQGHIPPGYRKVLWIALGINALMFLVEIVAGLAAGSVSLLADAIDFLGDAGNYGLSLAVLAMATVWRSRAALLKAACMLGFGVAVLARAGWVAWHGGSPEPLTMGVVGTLALVANVGVGVMLYAYREGDANMRGVWLCTRNDAISNVAVVLAAVGVFGTGTRWPDLGVAAIMGLLAVSAGLAVAKQARAELSG